MTDFARIAGSSTLTTFEPTGLVLDGAFILVALVIGYAALLWVLGRALASRRLIARTGPWASRSRTLREGIERARSWLVPPDRTRGWLVTRLEFAVAIGSIALATNTFLVAAQPTLGGDGTLPVVSLGALALMLVGLAWMVRIYRAPLRLDSKAYWRYHDGP